MRELNRAFARADRKLRLEKNDALERAAEPVRSSAESLASATIKPGKVPWDAMRIGVTQRVVYVAPLQRSTRVARRKRKNLAGLLMDQAMQPALDMHRSEVVERVDDLLADVGREWERG